MLCYEDPFKSRTENNVSGTMQVLLNAGLLVETTPMRELIKEMPGMVSAIGMV